MKTLKISKTFLGILALINIISLTATAETESDVQGDVWHITYPYWQSQNVSNQPNIDIKEIKAEISGDQITLSMTLWPEGSFSRNQFEYAAYIMFYNTSDAYYMMSYSDIIGLDPFGSAMGFSLNGGYLPSSAEVTVSGDTISATLDKVGDDTIKVEFYGTAWMYEKFNEEQYLRDSWHDWVGDYSWNPEIEPGDEDEDDDVIIAPPQDNQTTSKKEDKGTPGFEAVAVIAAIAITFILLRKKK